MRSLHQLASGHRRTALAVGALSLLTILSACGGTTQPAPGSSATGDSSKTIVFSPLALKIPAMKGLSEGVKGYGGSKGYEVIVQDPDLDPQKQVTELKSVVESGRAGGAWVIAVQPAALSDLVKTAQEKKRPAAAQRRPGGLRPGRHASRDHVRQDRLRRPRQGQG